ncbi:MAG TPA: hypothetical protein GXZ67_07155 [Clostridiaceae bacterium]|nr:hypothetical protein [Clostridiaceae bacterium]
MRTAREKSNYKFPLFGLVLIAFAVLLGLHALGIADDYFYVKVVFSVLLGGISIYSLFRLRFVVTFLPVVGVLYIWRDMLGIENVNFWALALPAFLLGVGMSMIVHRSHPERAFVWHTNLEANSDEDIQANDAEGYVSASCRFGEKTRYIHLQTLKKVVLDLQFGEMKIFFDPTAIAEQGLVIHANVSFGELELTVPRTWEIDNHVSVFAGTVTEPQVISGEARTKVKLVGNVNFAEITIHYI